MKTVLNRLARLALVAGVAACGGGDGGVGPVTVASVVITAPATAPVFGALGRTATFAAQALDASGAPIAGKTITWSSSNTGVAAISSAGVVSAAGNGTTEIRATADGVQSPAVIVTVAQVTQSVTITPGSVTFGAFGSTRQLTAEARDSTNNVIAGKVATWTGGTAGIATVSAAGLVTSAGNGTTQATATIDGIAANAAITVAAVAAAVAVTPGSATFQTIGRTQQFSASVRDSNNNVLARPVTWSTTNAAAIVVDNNGLATVQGQGSAQVRATADGIIGSATMTASIVVLDIQVQPIAVFTRLGAQRPIVAQARDSLANVVPGLTLTYQSSDPAVASVNAATATVTSQSDGVVTITVGVTGGAVTGTTAVTVAAVALDVATVPASIAFGAVGSQRQIVAVVRDSGFITIPGRTITFSRVGPGTTATVSAGGLVQSIATGTGDTAVATYSGADATVAAKVPVSVTQVAAVVTVSSPTPTPDTLKATGRTVQYSAAAADSNGNAIPGAAFTWVSSLPAVAAVDVTGLVTAGTTDGGSNITASSGPGSGSRPIVVRRYAETFMLTPGSAAIATNGGTQNFAATAQDSAGTNLPVTWVSRNTTILTLSAGTGANVTATARGNGSTFVVMSAGTRTDSAQVTITNQASVSFAAQIQPILTANCAVSGCHTGAVPTGPGLNMSPGQAYNNLVSVASVQQPMLMRVQPGDPNNSYMVRKLEGGPGISGDQMPQGNPPLSNANITLIRNWIAAGAPNN